MCSSSLHSPLVYVFVNIARLAAAKEAAESRASQSTIRPRQLIRKTKRGLQRANSIESIDSSSDVVVNLTFLTLEERMRRLRRKAVVGHSEIWSRERLNVLNNKDHAPSCEQRYPSTDILVDMKFLFQTIFIFVRKPDKANLPHKIINRSLHWAVSTSLKLVSNFFVKH